MIDFCVLGSGIAGATIANILSKKYTVCVVDKAKGVGGRASNKKFKNIGNFDHGLQYFTKDNKQFYIFLKKLIKKKILKEWQGTHLDFNFERNENNPKIIGSKGNNDLNKLLLKNIKKKLSNEVIKVKRINNYWSIIGTKEVILAKNLIVTFPYLQTKKLLNFYLNKSFKNMKVSMELNITLMVTEKRNSNIPISSIKFNNKIIAWASNENSKMRFISKKNLWTIQTTIKFSNKIINKYKTNKLKFSNIILKEFSKLTGLNFNSFKVLQIHGWKYSYNFTKTNLDSIWNKNFCYGICADWFIGSKAHCAWMSANNLYLQIKKNPPNIRRV